jgi:hypothetical protein
MERSLCIEAGEIIMEELGLYTSVMWARDSDDCGCERHGGKWL